MQKTKLLVIGFIILTIAALAALFFYSQSSIMMNPAGEIAEKQRNLIIIATALMGIIVVPIFAMFFFFAWKYRANNQKAEYKPNWDHNSAYELAWWGIPTVIIGVLAVITWQSTHALDPYKPLESAKQPLKVQVVALQWKWLFIYPEQKIATVNYLRIPEDTPINFELTSDAPMNSFWIPSLGGQVYAMSGMSTKLHLIADKTGTYDGMSANISGEGFAGMQFKVNAVPKDSFTRWAASIKETDGVLDSLVYKKLAEPSKNSPPQTYKLQDTSLYDTIVNKYMQPPAPTSPGSEVKEQSHYEHGGRD